MLLGPACMWCTKPLLGQKNVGLFQIFISTPSIEEHSGNLSVFGIHTSISIAVELTNKMYNW
jgi:hypothetical protein